MNIQFVKIFLALVISLSMGLSPYAVADIASDINNGNLPLETIVKNAVDNNVSAKDIVTQLIDAGVNPVIAAEFVVNTVPDAAVEIAKAAAKKVPDAAADIAGTVAQVMPEAAADIASAVAQVVPQAATDIASVVAQVAPKAAADIAGAVAQEVPDAAVDIASVVAQAVPEAAVDIANVVAHAAPDAADDIANAVTQVVPNAEVGIASVVVAQADPEVATNIEKTETQGTQPSTGGSEVGNETTDAGNQDEDDEEICKEECVKISVCKDDWCSIPIDCPPASPHRPHQKCSNFVECQVCEFKLVCEEKCL